jgi:hypothetical protein
MRKLSVADVQDFKIIPKATTRCVVFAAVVREGVESAAEIDKTNRALVCVDHVMPNTPHLTVPTL